VKLRPQSVFGADFNRSDGSARLAERSDLGTLLVTAAIDPIAARSELRARLDFDVPLEANATPKADRYRTLWLTPRSWIVQCPADEERALALEINKAFPKKEVHAVPVTDQLCWLELSGAHAPNLLSERGFISLEPAGLPIGCAKRTRLAEVAVIALHLDSQSWLLGVERSRAMYLARWLSYDHFHPATLEVKSSKK
jgi:heterotetrameric sarcosine oxidase gamma subunit